jgi:hypothetical protein
LAPATRQRHRAGSRHTAASATHCGCWWFSHTILAFAHNRNGTVTYVCHCRGLTEVQVFVAYDTADDIEMPRTHRRAIFVRNFDDERDGLPEFVQAYFASREYAWGVIQGVDHFCSGTAVPE